MKYKMGIFVLIFICSLAACTVQPQDTASPPAASATMGITQVPTTRVPPFIRTITPSATPINPMIQLRTVIESLDPGLYLVYEHYYSYLISMDSATRRIIGNFSNTSRISPNGQYFACWEEKNSDFHLIVYNIQSAERVEIPVEQSCRITRRIGWSPDSTSIVLNCGDHISLFDVLSRNQIGTLGISDVFTPPADGEAHLREISWSPDGNRLAYIISTSIGGQIFSSILITDVSCILNHEDCSKRTQEIETQQTGSDIFWISQSEIAVLTLFYPTASLIDIYDVQSHELVRQIKPDNDGHHVSFTASSDGRYVALLYVEPDNSVSIMIINTETGEKNRIVIGLDLSTISELDFFIEK